jgi:hypothetical protein
MRSLIRQACGLEPESETMSFIGAVCVTVLLPVAIVIVGVAFGWGLV